jgi:glycosyltransferase involved in cell wall biosynthesis
MQIGFDATSWTNLRGYGRFARSLLSAAVALDRSNEYVFFVDSETEEFPFPESVRVVRVASKVPTAVAAAANGRRSLRDIWNMSQTISREKLDLFFFPAVYGYVPVTSSVPVVVAKHDAIAEFFPELVFPTLRAKLYWAAKVKLACAQARLVVTVSEYARRCLIERLKIAPSRIRVVHEASSPVFRRLENPEGQVLLTRLGVPPGGRFLAYVGGLSPHKNLSLLVEVFRELQAQGQFADLRLVLVGDYQADVFYSCYPQLAGQVKQAGLESKVLFAGRLPDEDLVVLLNLAQALVLPSFSEGFGLPAVEAAACGAPVVATTESPLAELLGKGIIAVEPRDHAGWRAALARVLSDGRLREEMGAAGLEAAARLSWENSARQLLAVFDEVVRDRGSSL